MNFIFFHPLTVYVVKRRLMINKPFRCSDLNYLHAILTSILFSGMFSIKLKALAIVFTINGYQDVLDNSETS
jgi:hypothetical protein